MKNQILICVALSTFIIGCQSTTESASSNNGQCTTGNKSSASLTMNDFNASVVECGGVAIDADALAGTTANFSFGGKKERIAYFDGKGNATYQMVDKKQSEKVAYSFTEEGYLELKWPEGEVWYWSKLNETSDGWLLKTYWESKDGKDKEIFNLAVKLNR